MMSGKSLFRDTARGKIKGVCAGIADYFGMEVWAVRIIAMTLFLFSSGMVIVAYVVLTLMLDKKPIELRDNYSEEPRMKQSSWQSGLTPLQTMAELQKRFDDLGCRIGHLERYVTSKKFDLNRQFKNL